MKVVFIAPQTEGENDVRLSCQQAGIDLQLFGLPYVSENVPVMCPDHNYTMITPSDVGRVIDNHSADLYVLRYPQPDWSLPKNLDKVVCWCSEQGRTRWWAERSILPYDKIGVNCQLEVDYYKRTYSNKKIFYLPFGCYSPDIVNTDVQDKLFDLIVTSRCHSGCMHDEGNFRLRSIETMVIPLLDHNIALYGFGCSSGWDGIPGVGQENMGFFNYWEYPKVLATAKLYIGVTWNWAHGGFGIQLARALSTGIPVVWQETPGLDLEGFEKGNQLDWSSSPRETKHLVDFYLSHDQARIDMGERGRQWVLKNWQWSKIFERVVKEVQK